MGRWSGKTCRLSTMILLTGSFFAVEIIVGYIVNSVALVADSFHMLSDVVSLIVGLAAVKISTMNSKKNTFGWARAEVLGALVNAVFLCALCFTIIIDAVQRIYEPEHIVQPELMLAVGGIGLAVNLFGLVLFGGHAHSHGGGGGSHGHSHGGEKTTDSSEIVALTDSHIADPETVRVEKGGLVNGGLVHANDHSHEESLKARKQTAHQLNMRGVFLHVLGDALGSVVVIISGLIIKYVPMTAEGESPEWTLYVDPGLSIAIVIIILGTSFPLLKESGMILLQTVPPHIIVSQLQSDLREIEGIFDVHELHVWRLAGDKVIASVHIKIQSLQEYTPMLAKIKEFFHENGIHSVTIQPELLDLYSEKVGRDCSLECGPDMSCYSDTCCAKKMKGVKSSPAVELLDNGGANEEGIAEDALVIVDEAGRSRVMDSSANNSASTQNPTVIITDTTTAIIPLEPPSSSVAVDISENGTINDGSMVMSDASKGR